MGTLYIVATPIGHLKDITLRALEILKSVDIIAAEDTRHSKRLLEAYSINKPLMAYHEHNETRQAKVLCDRLLEGKNIALISDAGTPLISDPGYHLVHEAKRANIPVVPIPGPCAAIAALSASGLPTHKFVFEGFLPAKLQQRQKQLQTLVSESRTLIFYESPHRILDTLEDMVALLGPHRAASLARELTKIHETILWGTLHELLEKIKAEEENQKGEFVIIVEGNRLQKDTLQEGERIVHILLESCSLKEAVRMAAKITGTPKNKLYEYALRSRSQDTPL